MLNVCRFTMSAGLAVVVNPDAEDDKGDDVEDARSIISISRASIKKWGIITIQQHRGQQPGP
jgi:hypothetical protein